MDPLKRRYKNRILSALPKTEIESLERHLTPVTLKKKSILCLAATRFDMGNSSFCE